jgi:hypothetical protein
VYGKHVALCLMKPGQHEDVSADGAVTGAFCHVRVEHQSCIWASFEPLLRRGLTIDKGRFDVPCKPNLVGGCHRDGSLFGEEVPL